MFLGEIMKNKFYKILCLVFLCIMIVPMFAGCQSTEKTESYFDTTAISSTRFEYDSTENKTKVVWATKLTNGTIYNFEGFSVKFNIFLNNTKIGTETYSYSRNVKHGNDYTGAFNFYVDGEVDKIEYVSWTADYSSFWDTYSIWFIVLISIVALAAIIYLILMIIMQFELDEAWDNIVDFFEEHGWVATIFIIPFAGAIYGFVTENWVPVLLVLGAVVILVLLVLLTHLIQYIIFNKQGMSGTSQNARQYVDEKGNVFDPSIENVEDYKNDPQMLELFTTRTLKDYCKDNEISGYSTLNKSQIIEIITKNKKRNQTNKTTINKSKNIKKENKITFNDIAGLETAKQSFKEKVVYAFKHKELYEKYGKKVGGGILLYGLPGTGKTMFAEAASNETDSLFIPIKCSDIKSKWYGESEAKIKGIFDKARKAGKAIIFFDEFEAIGAKRSDNSDNGNNDLVPQILAEMQGVNSNNSNSVIVVIAATNKPWAIDSAFLRPGRFDEKIYIPLPDEIARAKLFELKLKKVPTENIDYAKMAKMTDGFNGADITEFCEKLKMKAIKKSLQENNEHIVTMEDVKEISKTIKSSVLDEDVEKLKVFEKKF